MATAMTTATTIVLPARIKSALANKVLVSQGAEPPLLPPSPATDSTLLSLLSLPLLLQPVGSQG